MPSSSALCEYVNTETKHRCKNKKGIYPHYCWRHTDKLENLSVRLSQVKGAGMGLFAGSKGFAKGEGIIQYGIPEIKVKEKVLNKKCSTAKDFAKCWGDYVFCDEGTCWDANKPKTTVARYANDCHRSGFKCNAEFEMRDGVPWIVATKKINPKEEVFCSYGEDYWNAKEQH